MVLKALISFFLIITISYAQDNSAKFVKEKIEIKELKKQLNDFYNKKEIEYKQRKKELSDLLAKIESQKAEIVKIRDENRQILKDIKGEVESKTSKIYNKMKPKIAASVFNKMINEGKIEEVFDIILKLKEKKVTLLFKYLSPKNASLITQMLQEYNVSNNNVPN